MTTASGPSRARGRAPRGCGSRRFSPVAAVGVVSGPRSPMMNSFHGVSCGNPCQYSLKPGIRTVSSYPLRALRRPSSRRLKLSTGWSASHRAVDAKEEIPELARTSPNRSRDQAKPVLRAIHRRACLHSIKQTQVKRLQMVPVRLRGACFQAEAVEH